MLFVAVVLLFAFVNGRLWEQQKGVDFSDVANLRLAFDQWKADFNKKYESVEVEGNKYLIFLDTWRSIVEWNENPQGNWTQKVNQFTDMTREEFTAWIRRGSPPKRAYARGDNYWADLSHVEVPKSVDWTTKGVVTPVKNQGQCGSCWSFSTTGCIECRYAIKNGVLNSLAEQQLVDCSGSYGNQGCNGGWPYKAMEYVVSEGGLCLESKYPYTAQDGSCQASSCGTKYDAITSEEYVQTDSTRSLEASIAQGCTSVLVDAPPWQSYSGGVFDSTCGTSLDHAVLAVGYGSNGQDYWKIKNSWGASWGMEGYILLCRNCNMNGNSGECGVLMQPSYAVV
jgi:cathepsin L